MAREDKQCGPVAHGRIEIRTKTVLKDMSAEQTETWQTSHAAMQPSSAKPRSRTARGGVFGSVHLFSIVNYERAALPFSLARLDRDLCFNACNCRLLNSLSASMINKPLVLHTRTLPTLMYTPYSCLEHPHSLIPAEQ